MCAELIRGLRLVVSKSCTLVDSTTCRAGTLMLTTGESEVGGYTSHCCAEVSVMTRSHILALVCALTGVVLGCSGICEGNVKGVGVSRGPTTLGRAILVDVDTSAASWRQASCTL